MSRFPLQDLLGQSGAAGKRALDQLLHGFTVNHLWAFLCVAVHHVES